MLRQTHYDLGGAKLHMKYDTAPSNAYDVTSLTCNGNSIYGKERKEFLIRVAEREGMTYDKKWQFRQFMRNLQKFLVEKYGEHMVVETDYFNNTL